ncbi:VOC family protein [Halioglobus maricola]|uniref:VOC family protein n=1 Tax=Halioglobus maricola TaxID=2601894 RepID=A0A5P9NIK2_9GAMM|nr:VOC family protein [Halioglobus maricola]QFU75612.1 VOC family protein [Halioglobus maricola]
MHVGAFSISLAVKDLATSRDFYEKLGFSVFAGEMEHKFLMLNNGEHVIGLFQDMFELNTLTFNPGWDQTGQNAEGFTDVRQWQAHLQQQGVTIDQEVTSESGAGFFLVHDPDGNPILFDQHRAD